jgi:hypothetical protein
MCEEFDAMPNRSILSKRSSFVHAIALTTALMLIASYSNHRTVGSLSDRLHLVIAQSSQEFSDLGRSRFLRSQRLRSANRPENANQLN